MFCPYMRHEATKNSDLWETRNKWGEVSPNIAVFNVLREFPGCNMDRGKLGKVQRTPWVNKNELRVQGDHRSSQGTNGEENAA